MSHDYYRPNGYYEKWTPLDHFPPPPPPPEMPPMPPARRFRGNEMDSYRPDSRNYGSYGHSQRNDFSFRTNGQAPAYPNQQEIDHITDNARPAQRHSQPYRGRGRGRGARIVTAERPLLQIQRGEVSQTVLGSAGDSNATQRFLSADNITDSEDESMDESNSEDDTSPRKTSARTDGTGDALEPPTKRRATTKDSSDGSGVPKWSNPDPYTVLPPVDEEQRKRKDVVKLIRKARVATEKEQATQNEVAANDDFISFGVEDDRNSEEEDPRAPSISGAPTGPRLPTKPQQAHSVTTNGAPGMFPMSSTISQLGPPPGLASNPSNALPLPTQSLTSKPGIEELQHKSRNEQDANLGSRKRTRNDEIKPALRRPLVKKGKGVPSNGSLAREWVPRRDQDPTPWLVQSRYRTENAGFRLHKEICDFYDFVKPRSFEQKIREELLQKLQAAVRHEMPNCDVHCFGSFAAGLYLPNADMDVVIISQSFRIRGEKTACQTKTQMHKFGRYLESTVAERGSIEVITGAKVPIIKFVDRATAIRVDLSFENDTGIIANDTFAYWKRQFPAMPILVTVIKQFLMIRGLNDVSTGGLGGFSVTCLVTSLLQNMPCVQIGENIPEHHLGEMLIEFLDFYGNQLDISRTGIMMSPPGYFDKIAHSRNQSVYQASRADRLAIIDPNKPENDISGGSRSVPLIFERFSRGYEEIMIAMKNSNRLSLLDWMLGGDYENFTWQRDHLRDLYERRWGPVEPDPLLLPIISEYIPDPPSLNGVAGSNNHPPLATTHNTDSHNSNTYLRDTSNDKSAKTVPAQPKPTIARKKKKGPAPNKSKGELRAQRLKKQFPMIDNLPKAIGPKQCKQLTERYNEQLGTESRPKPKRPKKPKASKIKGKQGKTSHGGASKKNPITID